MWSERTRRLIESALEEDIGPGDVTAALLPEPRRRTHARIVARRPGIACGLELAPLICEIAARHLDAELGIEPADPVVHDGDALGSATTLARLTGPLAPVLMLERTLLNFLGRMSGVATLTRRYVDVARAANPDVQVLDTRKTIPGWRELDKYAVRCGGGTNHRTGLYDAVLLKDNHLAGIPIPRLAGTLFEMLNRIGEGGAVDPDRGRIPRPTFVEVEVDTLAQLEQVLKVVGVNVVLLDNFGCQDMRRAVAMRDALGLRGRVHLEASGSVTLETIADAAATGVDRIAVGAITHSAPALDVGLDFDG